MLLIISLIILIIISTWIYMWFQNSALIHILFSTCSTNYHHYANVIKTEDWYHFWTGTNLFLLNCIKGGCFHLHICPLKKKKKCSLKLTHRNVCIFSILCFFLPFCLFCSVHRLSVTILTVQIFLKSNNCYVSLFSC